MRPLNLKEFAQQLRMEGNPFADEILELSTVYDDVAEPYYELCAELEHHAPDNLKNDPTKALEWLGNRSGMLAEIEEQFEEADRAGDVDDAVKEVLGELDNIETIMREHGGWIEGDLQDALFALIERAGKISNDLEYDL